ncbi:MAG: helix-turn-helix transcriptional regulator, partial [Clostridia bacterium]|nr:helix-turn-helix transcriptional regulator [Clostridia bacterium]
MDTLKVGKNIAALRRSAGYSQEKLADILGISPQAISKWENGKSLPETALLPRLSELFDCTVDSLLLVESKQPAQLDYKTKQIAKQVLSEIEKQISDAQGISFSNDEIAQALYRSEGNIGACIINRKNTFSAGGCTFSEISVSARQISFELLEKRWETETAELSAYSLLHGRLPSIAHLYSIDKSRGLLLLEKTDESFINGINYDKKTNEGKIFSSNIENILKALALWHKTLWSNTDSFHTNGSFHTAMLCKEYDRYVKNEQSEKVPKVFKSTINGYCEKEREILEKAVKLLLSSNEKQPLTVIHGNLNPGMINVSRDGRVVFENLSAVRSGRPTDDLAMMISLHIAPEYDKALPYLEYYCNSLDIGSYGIADMVSDYKISLAKCLMYTLRLINGGIYDFEMKNKAIAAFSEWSNI